MDPRPGNRASEQAQAERGADFSRLNESGLPPTPEPIEVTVKGGNGDDLELDPEHLEKVAESAMVRSLQRRIELEHTEDDLLMAQLTEEPQNLFMVPGAGEVRTSESRLTKALSRNRNREELIWYGVTPKDLMACTGDRVIIRQDTLESEYSCPECKGEGYGEEVCDGCRGEQKRDGADCRACVVSGYSRSAKWSCGKRPCAACRGVGWRAGVIIPEVAQTRPVSGIVVSLGPNTNLSKLGDRVLHSKFSGHCLTTPNGESFTIMRESEILSLIREK